MGLKISVRLCHPPMWFKYYICGRCGNREPEGLLIAAIKRSRFALKNGKSNQGVCPNAPGCSRRNRREPRLPTRRLPARGGKDRPSARGVRLGGVGGRPGSRLRLRVPTEEAAPGPGPTLSGWRPRLVSLSPASTQQRAAPSARRPPSWSLPASKLFLCRCQRDKVQTPKKTGQALPSSLRPAPSPSHEPHLPGQQGRTALLDHGPQLAGP